MLSGINIPVTPKLKRKLYRVDMGKNFEKELLYLSITIGESLKKDISALISFFKYSKGNNIITIGSGGSHSVAFTAEYLSGRAGYFVKTVTPYELSTQTLEIYRSSVILFTAGGGNRDTLNAYRFAADLEPMTLLTVCAKINAPVKRIQKDNLHNYYYEMNLSAGKDGYLAVNSLMASIIVIARTLFELTHDKFFQVKEESINLRSKLCENVEILDRVLERETLIVLYGGMAAPVAIDMESKFSETSLGNIQLVDYRNFAHGRHFWIRDRMMSTSVIMLQGPMEKSIASKTKELLPAEVPVLTIKSEKNNINGMIELFSEMFQLVAYAGKKRGINPGKPSVAEFGKKLYHLNYDIRKEETYVNFKNDILEMAIHRKCECFDNELKKGYKKVLYKILEKQERTKFKGIIFDYDGTLHDKKKESDLEDAIWNQITTMLEAEIIVGIATGRGKSVREEIKSKIPNALLKNIWIAYYNGCVIGKADEGNIPNLEGKTIPQIYCIMSEDLKMMGGKELYIELRPYQLTVIDSDKTGMPVKKYAECLERYKDYQSVISSHSMDVIPKSEGKRNLLKFWVQKKMLQDDEVLCIGDSGDKEGNDFELLDDWKGLSVDMVSNRPDACWNLAPMGIRNLEATRYYLDHIDLQQDGCFRIKWGNKYYAGRTGRKNTNKNNGLEGCKTD